MTPNEIEELRRQLGLSQAGLADVMGLTPKTGRRTVARWEHGEIDISGPAAVLLRYMIKYGLPDVAL